MKLLTNYIINVYAWFWCTVKAKPEFYNSPRHIFQMIQKVNIINDIRITTEFLKTIQFNSCLLHSENMLLAMLTDLRAEVRVKAVAIILTCKDTPEV